MANYTIIGGDGKEYGSITDADIRKWISEGRLNAQSLAKAESDAAFRPLSAFPEFANAFVQTHQTGTPPPIAPPGVDGRAAALSKIKIPAVGLIVTAIINIVLALWSLFSTPDMQELNAQIQQLNNPQLEAFFQKMTQMMHGPLAIANIVFELVVSVLILIGAIKMQSLRNYGFAFAAAILAVVPCLTPCCGYVVGIAFGIWALIVLNKPEIKSHFK